MAVPTATQQPPSQPPQPPPPAERSQPQQPPPRFRTETNFVRVDVYATKDGAPVQDLKQDDFELFEDNTPQKIDTFEHIVVMPAGPDPLSEPSSVTHANQLAADSERSAIGHRLAGVQGEIQESLAQHRRVAVHGSRAVAGHLQDVTADGPVGREDDVGLGEFLTDAGPLQAGVLQDLQFGREPLALLPPVEDQRRCDSPYRGPPGYLGGAPVGGGAGCIAHAEEKHPSEQRSV